jgi:hypothetical protein
MKTTTAYDLDDIGYAIAQSRDYNSLVTVPLAPDVSIKTAIHWVTLFAENFEVVALDRFHEEVWGGEQGGEFRLRIVEADAAYAADAADIAYADATP